MIAFLTVANVSLPALHNDTASISDAFLSLSRYSAFSSTRDTMVLRGLPTLDAKKKAINSRIFLIDLYYRY